MWGSGRTWVDEPDASIAAEAVLALGVPKELPDVPTQEPEGFAGRPTVPVGVFNLQDDAIIAVRNEDVGTSSSSPAFLKGTLGLDFALRVPTP